MKKVTFAIWGMGNRGTRYAACQLMFPEEMEVVAMADVRRGRLDAANKYLHLPEDRLFADGAEMLKLPKMADIMVIATQDAQHRQHAIAAMEHGYDLLLEKPIASTLEDCKAVLEAAHKYNRRIIVCHVLRYTVFYQQVKRIIDSGILGKIESLDMIEQVGYYHIAHSYVRGNWHKLADSSPMILAKCCHDLDLMVWLTGKDVQRVSSFGSLDHFKAENCPEGATERCHDCKVDCPYNAEKFYLSRIPGWPTNILHPEPTEENILEVLKTSDYGKCAFKMDNDVVDHQVVNVLLDGGTTVSFTMCGFTGKQDRRIHVMGTLGDLYGDFRSNKLTLRIFGKPDEELDYSQVDTNHSGHGGGDHRMIHDVIRCVRGDEFDSSAITVIDRSMQSHFAAFAAEKSRVQNGQVIDLKEFLK